MAILLNIFYDYTTLQIKLRYSSHTTTSFRRVNLDMCQSQGLLCPVKHPFEYSRYLAGHLIARPDRVVASLQSGDCVIADGCLIGLAGGENQFPNRVCQRGCLLRETVPCDAMTSGFVSDLFTVRLDDKGQTMLVIYLQFTLSKKAKQSILTMCLSSKCFFSFFKNCLHVYKMLH